MSHDLYAQVGPIHTRYWTEGTRGPAVLLLHGLGGFIENWWPNFSALAAGHRVFALDLLGHGLTGKPRSGAYDVSALAGFVKSFMTVLQIERAHMVGHSLGGAITLQFTLQFPGMSEKLVLVESAGLGQGVSGLLGLVSLPVLGEVARHSMSRDVMAQGLRRSVHDPTVWTEALIELHYRMARQPGAQPAFLKTARAMGNLFGQDQRMYRPIIQGLRQITNPTLVIWGREDRVVPLAHAQVATQGLPNARLRIFEKCGHFPMLEHSQAFNQALLEFLNYP